MIKKRWLIYLTSSINLFKKEAGDREEMAKIASVYIIEIIQGMPLQDGAT